MKCDEISAVRLRACAKINLVLDVVGLLPNRYHALDGVMQSISLADTVVVKKSGVPGIRLTMRGCDIPADPTNIAYRAAQKLLEAAGLPLSLEIVVEKKIPVAAGLGGGSADGAAVLRGICRLYGIDPNSDLVHRVALSVGADLPFCLSGGAYRAQGVGEKLTKVSALSGCFLTVARMGEGVSTPEAYGWVDRLPNASVSVAGESPRTNLLLTALEKGDPLRVAACLYNRFEEAVLPRRPDAAWVREQLLAAGAAGALMSGSGTAVFGIFTERESAETAAGRIHAAGGFASVCEPVSETYASIAEAITDESFSR